MASWQWESDDGLLEACASDAGAFTALYRRYEGAVLAFFFRRTMDPELAADLAAEVFAAVLLSSRRYRPGEGPAHAWLFGIAQHKLADSRRRGVVADRARRRLGMSPIELDDQDLERIEHEAGNTVALLEQLPADQRDAVRARIIEEKPYREIASELRCSEAVVRKRVSRGLAMLREELTKEGT